MARQLYYEDVEVGTEVTPLAKIATTRMLVQWAGASGTAILCIMTTILPRPRVSVHVLSMVLSKGPGWDN